MPSSLTMLLPSALGFSPHPPVSVYGTGACCSIAAFPGTGPAVLPYSFSVRLTPAFLGEAFPSPTARRLHRFSLSRPTASPCVPAVLTARSTGFSTCCPSATPLGLALGPDLPRADQLYPGNLGYPAGRIPTFLSLLIPAFSLLNTPRTLTGTLPCVNNAPLPPVLGTGPELRRCVSAPDIFGAGPLG